MSSPAEVGTADEALKALFARFRDAPGSAAFLELSEALLARGHASEALQVAELGLQLRPESTHGRVQRASALLALGRPRVAYVELLRALAIEPNHHRGMRLLGRVFVEAGAPARAAKLLAKRLGNQLAMPASDSISTDLPPEPPRPIPEPTIDLDKTDATGIELARSLEAGLLRRAAPEGRSLRGGSPVSELFAALTSDLGLGPQTSVRTRVEVTQVIRTRPAKTTSRELSGIEGPIVDTTQPGEVVSQGDGPGAQRDYAPPTTLLDVVTSPQFNLGVTIDDEPLFNESMPFEIRPVESASSALDADDTVTDDSPTHVEMNMLRGSMNAESESQTPTDIEGAYEYQKPGPPSLSRAAPASLFREVSPLVEGEDATPLPDTGHLEDDISYLKRYKKARSPTNAPMVVVEPPVKLSRVALAGVSALILLGYLAVLGWVGRDELRLWLFGNKPTSTASQQSR